MTERALRARELVNHTGDFRNSLRGLLLLAEELEKDRYELGYELKQEFELMEWLRESGFTFEGFTQGASR